MVSASGMTRRRGEKVKQKTFLRPLHSIAVDGPGKNGQWNGAKRLRCEKRHSLNVEISLRNFLCTANDRANLLEGIEVERKPIGHIHT